jgi:hypothetical protein
MTERSSIHCAAKQMENQAPRALNVPSVKPPIVNRPILSPKSLNDQQSTSSSQEQKKKRHWFQKLRIPFFCRALEEEEPLNLLRSAQSAAEFSCIEQHRTDVDETFEQFGFTKTPQWEELEGINLPFFAPLHELDDESLELLQKQVFGMPLLSDSDSSSVTFIQYIELSEPISVTSNVPAGGSPVIDEEGLSLLQAERINLSQLILSNCSGCLSSSVQSSRDLILDIKNSEGEQHEDRLLSPSSFYSPIVEDTAICTYESKVDDVSSPVHLYSGISDLLLSPSRLLGEGCAEHFEEEQKSETIQKRPNSCPTHRPKTLELDYPQRFRSLVGTFKEHHLNSGER